MLIVADEGRLTPHRRRPSAATAKASRTSSITTACAARLAIGREGRAAPAVLRHRAYACARTTPSVPRLWAITADETSAAGRPRALAKGPTFAEGQARTTARRDAIASGDKAKRLGRQRARQQRRPSVRSLLQERSMPAAMTRGRCARPGAIKTSRAASRGASGSACVHRVEPRLDPAAGALGPPSPTA